MNAFPICFGFARVAANHSHVICKINSPENLGEKGAWPGINCKIIFLALYMSLEHTLKSLLRFTKAVFHNIRFSTGSWICMR